MSPHVSSPNGWKEGRWWNISTTDKSFWLCTLSFLWPLRGSVLAQKKKNKKKTKKKNNKKKKTPLTVRNVVFSEVDSALEGKAG